MTRAPGRGALKVVLVAEESAGVQVLKSLQSAPGEPELVAVLTAIDRQDGRRALVAEAAAQLGLEPLPATRLRDPDFASWLRDRDVDLLLNVHSLFVLPATVVAAPRIGSFNLHPGPLPEYAGLNAPSWAIYRGEQTHAVTLHWMDARIDTGSVAYEAAVDIDESETGLSLTAKCVREGVPLVLRLVADATRGAGSIPAHEQDLSRRRYYGREVPQDGRVLWSAPAREIVRFVRAADYAPFPSPWGVPGARLRGRYVGIGKASLTHDPADEPPGTIGSAASDGSIAVASGDEWVSVHRLWLDGRYVTPAVACSVGERFDEVA